MYRATNITKEDKQPPVICTSTRANSASGYQSVLIVCVKIYSGRLSSSPAAIHELFLPVGTQKLIVCLSRGCLSHSAASRLLLTACHITRMQCISSLSVSTSWVSALFVCILNIIDCLSQYQNAMQIIIVCLFIVDVCLY
jgi:hypothetical protein